VSYKPGDVVFLVSIKGVSYKSGDVLSL
jgi:hypothetical protein